MDLHKFAHDKPLKKIAKKVEKYKESFSKKRIKTLFSQLAQLLEEDDKHVKEITFLISALGEHNYSILPDNLLPKVLTLFHSKHNDIKINTSSILGFYVVKDLQKNSRVLEELTKNLINALPAVKHNTLAILERLSRMDCMLSIQTVSNIIKSLWTESNVQDLISELSVLLNQEFLLLQHKRLLLLVYEFCKKKFPQSEELHQLSVRIISTFFPQFSQLSESDRVAIGRSPTLKFKTNLNHYLNYFSLNIGEFIEEYKEIQENKDTIAFIFKTGPHFHYYLYEFQKDRIQKFFSQPERLNFRKIHSFFSFFTSFPKTRHAVNYLLKKGIINGYFSLLGYFYSDNYLLKQLTEKLEKDGFINLQQFNHIPFEKLKSLLNDYKRSIQKASYHANLFINNARTRCYLLSTLVNRIKTVAHKNNQINFAQYKKIFSTNNYKLLINTCIQQKIILGNYYYKNIYLTPLGKKGIIDHLQTKKQLGYFHFKKICATLHIHLQLVKSIFEELYDKRMGIFNKEKTVFYITGGIKDIAIKKELKNILTDLNLKRISLLKELNTKSTVSIAHYCEKLGINQGELMKIVNTMKLSYIKEGDTLFLGEKLLEDKLQSWKDRMISMGKTKEDFYITGPTKDIPDITAYDKVSELLQEGHLQGFIYTENNRYKFITQKGLRNLFLRQKHYFSLHELFPNKHFSQEERVFIQKIIKDLIDKEYLEGSFSKDTLIFRDKDKYKTYTEDQIISTAEHKKSTYCKRYSRFLQLIAQLIYNDARELSKKEKALLKAIVSYVDQRQDEWYSKFDTLLFNLCETDALRKRQKDGTFEVTLRGDDRIIALENELKRYRANFKLLAAQLKNLLYLQRGFVREQKMKRNFDRHHKSSFKEKGPYKSQFFSNIWRIELLPHYIEKYHPDLLKNKTWMQFQK